MTEDRHSLCKEHTGDLQRVNQEGDCMVCAAEFELAALRIVVEEEISRFEIYGAVDVNRLRAAVEET